MIHKASTSERAPSWTEVILGAVLSILIGLILGAAYLILKPVATVREVPKDAVAGATYFIEGMRDSGRAGELAAKRRSFAEGQSVTVTEGELNSLFPAEPAAPPKAAAAAAAAPAGPWLQPGPLNVRLHDGLLQLGAPTEVRAFGFEQKIVVQARGTLHKQGGQLEFAPTVVLVGSCPVQRLPGVTHWLMTHVLLPRPVPADLAAGWAKVADAAIDGSSLRLTMP